MIQIVYDGAPFTSHKWERVAEIIEGTIDRLGANDAGDAILKRLSRIANRDKINAYLEEHAANLSAYATTQEWVEHDADHLQDCYAELVKLVEEGCDG